MTRLHKLMSGSGAAGSVILSALTHNLGLLVSFGVFFLIVLAWILSGDRRTQRANLLLRGTPLPPKPRKKTIPRATSRDFVSDRSGVIDRGRPIAPPVSSPALDPRARDYISYLRKSGSPELADRVERALMAPDKADDESPKQVENLEHPPQP